jgi:hypothetical protein
MDGFLENREKLVGENIKFVSGSPLGPSAAPSSPFGITATTSHVGHGKNNGSPGGHKARVETVLDDGRVSRIIVKCSCGEVTEIDCDYSNE